MKFKIIFMLLLIFPIVSAVNFPVLNDFVTDQADIISQEYEQKITELAKQIEQETTVEVAVVTVKSLEGISKEDYSAQLFEKYKIGKSDIDNGLLILVAMDERVYRVEVGYGLEGLIPDASKVALGTRILEPNFKQDEFGKGIYEMLLAVQGILNGEEEVISKYSSTYQSSRNTLLTWVYLFFILSMVIGALTKGSHRSRFMFIPLFMPGPRWNGGNGSFGSSGFGGFGGGSFGGGGFGGNF